MTASEDSGRADEEIAPSAAELSPLEVETNVVEDRADPASTLVGADMAMALFGLWLVVSPAMLDYEQEVNPIVCGAVVLFLALLRVFVPLPRRPLAIASIVLGAWIALSGFVLGEKIGEAMNLALTGTIVAVLAMVFLGARAQTTSSAARS